MKIKFILKIYLLIILFGCSQNKVEVDLQRIKAASDKLYPLHKVIFESNIKVNSYSELVNINSDNIASLSDEDLKIALDDVLKLCGCSQIYIFEDCQLFNIGQTQQSFKTEIYYVVESQKDCLSEANQILQFEESIERLDDNWCLVKTITSLAN